MSTVKHLFKLAVDLRVECQTNEVFLNIFHISGDRMIATGIDGRSQGDFDAGVSLGYDIRQFIPLDKGPFDLAGPLVEKWLKSCMGSDYSPPLEPIQWFWEWHQSGIHVWSPHQQQHLYH